VGKQNDETLEKWMMRFCLERARRRNLAGDEWEAGRAKSIRRGTIFPRHRGEDGSQTDRQAGEDSNGKTGDYTETGKTSLRPRKKNWACHAEKVRI